MNAVYREYFPTEPPTRATVGVTALAEDFRVEIEVHRGPLSADRRSSRGHGRTRNSSIATIGWPCVPTTSMVRVCAPGRRPAPAEDVGPRVERARGAGRPS